MKPKELLYAHRYTEAVHAFRQDMHENTDHNFHSAIGYALLASGTFDEAIESFRRNNEIESGRARGSFPSLNQIATALWLMGKRRDALLEWHHAIAGIIEGRISYGDAAGGASQGLLLWYGAVTSKNEAELEYAINYLRKLRERKNYGSAILWPRPIILMVLGDRSFAEVSNQVTESMDLTECVSRVRGDLLKRRQLCKLLF
jgi:tetratricopeptide (TPR) repeat protein